MENNIQQIINNYMTTQQQPVMLSVIIAVVTGLLICFFGYKLLRVWCAIVGFAAGALIAGLVAYAMNADAALLVAAIAGIITAVLSFLFYKSGVFVIGFGAALNILGNFINAYGISAQWWIIILAIVASVIVGCLAVRFVRPVVIISTSLSGATSIVTNILGIFQVTNWVIILSVIGIVAVLGMVYQFTHTRNKHKTKTDTIPEQPSASADEDDGSSDLPESEFEFEENTAFPETDMTEGNTDDTPFIIESTKPVEGNTDDTPFLIGNSKPAEEEESV